MRPTSSLGTRALVTLGGICVAGWTVFVHGAYWRVPTTNWQDTLVAFSPVVAVVLLVGTWMLRANWLPPLREALDRHTRAVDSMPLRTLGPAIALAATMHQLFT